MPGIYIHIPFCSQKCIYCDFYTAGSRIADWNTYVNTLLRELAERKHEIDYNIETLYLGGGTPSLIPEEPLVNLISGVKEICKVADFKEFTLEINPEDISLKKIFLWQSLGVNRVSVGIQSFVDDELTIIGRQHKTEETKNRLKELGCHFKNFTLDLMFGIPYQTIDSFKYSLETAVSLNPTHISLYTLMLEPNTAMTHLVETERISLPSESDVVKMFELSEKYLKSAGFRRYEISNYAKEGFESIHNSSYWLGSPYLGLGPGAHSYDGKNIRRENPKDLRGYLRRFGDSLPIEQDPTSRHFYKEEFLSDKELKEEMIMTRLRMGDGLDLNEFRKRFGYDSKENLLKKSRAFIKQGFLEETENRIKFSEKGFTISDYIISTLF